MVLPLSLLPLRQRSWMCRNASAEFSERKRAHLSTPSLAERSFSWIMTRHRSLVVVVFALPLSLLWDMVLWIRQIVVMRMRSAPHQHPERVRRVAEQVKARPKGMKMCTGRPGWQSMSLSYRDCKSAMTMRDHSLAAHRTHLPAAAFVSVCTQIRARATA